MADLRIPANAATTTARAAGQQHLDDATRAEISAWYRGAVTKGITDNQDRRPRPPATGCGWRVASATTRT